MDKNNKKALWTPPWGYSEGFFISVGLFTVSLALEFIVPFNYFPKPNFPLNFLYLIILFFVTILFFLLRKRLYFFKWLASAEAAIPSICFFLFFIILMGIIPQKPTIPNKTAFFNNITNTWFFFTTIIFLLLTLGSATISRLFPFSFKNITFFLNHFGLWIVLSAGYFGTTDKKEALLSVKEGDIVWYSIDSNGKIEELPIAIELVQFKAEFYDPKIVLVDKNNKLKYPQQDVNFKDNQNFKIDDLIIEIKKSFKKSYPIENDFIDAGGIPGSGASAFINIYDNDNKLIASDWICHSTIMYNEKSIFLDDGRIIRMLNPEPSYFGSEIKLYSQKSSGMIQGTVEVNNPLKLDNWWIYQYSYDSSAGADSEISIFKAVYDPWLYFIYCGFIMMLTGVFFMFIIFSFKKNNL